MTLKSIKENAVINITAIHRANGEEERTEMMTVGSFAARGKKFYIFYAEEGQSGPEASNVMLICDGNKVSFKRSGESELKFNFTEGERENVLYYFPFGAINITQKTNRVRCSLEDSGGTVELSYTLLMGGDEQENLLNIKVDRQK